MKIVDILISGTLKDFYDQYAETKQGHITNHIAGEKLYDLMVKNNVDILIEDSVKKELWNNCKKNYTKFYGMFAEYSNEAKKKLLTRYYKSAWMEYWLNLKANEGQIIELGTQTDIFLKGFNYKEIEEIRRHNDNLGMAIFDLQNPD